MNKTLLSKYALGDLILPNRVVMAALTRARATNPELTPTDLHVEYYAQRAGAGLIITESTWISKNAVGFINIPGIYSQGQIEGWKKVTEAVHQRNGRIFIQLVHSGSVSHPHYFGGKLPKGPSAINPGENVFTSEGFVPTLTPDELSLEDIKFIIEEFRLAAEHAKKAGFDGIELHAQIFTLIPQFLSTATNQRTDKYGGSTENRTRILFEILDQLIAVYPEQRIGIKFTPSAYNNGTIRPNESTIETFEYLLKRLSAYHLAFLEIVGTRVPLAETVLDAWDRDYFGWFRARYKGTIMANLGFGFDTANKIIEQRKADLVSFGSLFIANPDLVHRFENDSPLAIADENTFYNGEEKGYIDYPALT